MPYELNSKIAKKLIGIKGEVRGVALKTDSDFIFRKAGKQAVLAVEEELKALGVLLEYKKISSLNFYPLGLRALSLLAAQKVMNLSDEGIKEMGTSAPKTSLILKLFMQYFLSIRRTFNEMPNIWGKHYTIGKLIPLSMDEENKTASLRLEDFHLHPIFCQYATGYFSKIIEIVVKSPAKCKEVKCFFHGDKSHDFFMRW